MIDYQQRIEAVSSCMNPVITCLPFLQEKKKKYEKNGHIERIQHII